MGVIYMKFSSKLGRLGVGIAAAGAATALVAGAAVAAGPVLTITSPADGSTLTYTSFPQNVDVEGTVAYTGGSGGNTNLCGVKDLTVTVDDGAGMPDSVTQIGYVDEVASGNATTCAPLTSDTWSFPWEIGQAGEYTIRATARVAPSQETGSAEADVVVVYEETVIASYPAAPAVAAKILADNDAPARYGTGKSGGNHIADVAAEMNSTPGTDFRGVRKSDVAAYAAEVRAFLEGKGAIS
jgi:hypothetical protein